MEANIVESADRQQQNYHIREPQKLRVGQEVLLDNPTKEKLDPRWTGSWQVKEVKGPLNVRIIMDDKERLVHVNGVRPLLRAEQTTDGSIISERWSPPLFQHLREDCPESANREELPPPSQSEHPLITRAGRIVKPVDYYGF